MPRRKAPAATAAAIPQAPTKRRIRIVGHAIVDPKTLLAHPDNWRIHPEHQRAILKGSLDDLGYVKSAQVQKSTGIIIDGHARVMVAVHAGDTEFPVEYVDLDDAEVRKALASLDPISALADIDFSALDTNLSQIEAGNADLARLFDDLAGQVSEATEIAGSAGGKNKGNLKTLQRALAKRVVSARAVFTLEEAETFERALESTGVQNRAEAMMIVVRGYLATIGALEAGSSEDPEPDQQHVLAQMFDSTPVPGNLGA
jgi:hypothetical protein